MVDEKSWLKPQQNPPPQPSQRITREQLEIINSSHRRELRQIKNMNEVQFQVFKSNFSFGHLEGITKIEAHELLVSMIALNLKLQDEIEATPPQDH